MATIKDIARLAKVTPSTVSRVLNHSGGYSEKTRRRVEKIADELHYQKNEAAVNLVAQTSNLIGVIVTNATTSFAAPIIDSIEGSSPKCWCKLNSANLSFHKLKHTGFF